MPCIVKPKDCCQQLRPLSRNNTKIKNKQKAKQLTRSSAAQKKQQSSTVASEQRFPTFIEAERCSFSPSMVINKVQ